MAEWRLHCSAVRQCRVALFLVRGGPAGCRAFAVKALTSAACEISAVCKRRVLHRMPDGGKAPLALGPAGAAALTPPGRSMLQSWCEGGWPAVAAPPRTGALSACSPRGSERAWSAECRPCAAHSGEPAKGDEAKGNAHREGRCLLLARRQKRRWHQHLINHLRASCIASLEHCGRRSPGMRVDALCQCGDFEPTEDALERPRLCSRAGALRQFGGQASRVREHLVGRCDRAGDYTLSGSRRGRCWNRFGHMARSKWVRPAAVANVGKTLWQSPWQAGWEVGWQSASQRH